MPIFREKTVTVEAHQWDGTAKKAREIVQWAYPFVRYWTARPRLNVDTPYGVIEVFEGDWVIKQEGEFCVCNSETFDASYEEAVEELKGGGVYWR